MGMGYAGNSVESIEVETIKQFCHSEYQAFIDVLDSVEMLDDVARDIYYNLNELGENSEVYKKYIQLCESFKVKTGLDLFIGFHDSGDDGDRYDDVDGVFWGVDGMYELSEAGKRMKQYITHKSFVMFG